MTAEEYHALKIGDVVIVRATVTRTMPVGTMGNHRGWFEAEIRMGDNPPQRVHLEARRTELAPKEGT